MNEVPLTPEEQAHMSDASLYIKAITGLADVKAEIERLRERLASGVEEMGALAGTNERLRAELDEAREATMSDVKAVVHTIGMQRVLDELLELVHQEIMALPAGTDKEHLYLHVLRLDLRIARKRYSGRHKLEDDDE